MSLGPECLTIKMGLKNLVIDDKYHLEDHSSSFIWMQILSRKDRKIGVESDSESDRVHLHMAWSGHVGSRLYHKVAI